MYWVIVAAAIWLIILLFIRLSGLKKLWSVGVWSVLLAYFFNQTFVSKGLYSFQQAYFSYQQIPIPLLIGAAGLGIILIRFLPDEKWWQFAYLILFAAIVGALEYIAVRNDYLEFVRWSLDRSFIFRLCEYIAITWLSSLTVNKRKKSYRYR